MALESSDALASRIEATNADIAAVGADVQEAATAGIYPADRVAAWNALVRSWADFVNRINAWNPADWILRTGDAYDAAGGYRTRIAAVRAELVTLGAHVASPDVKPDAGGDPLARLERDAASVGRWAIGFVVVLGVVEIVRAVRE